MYDNRPSKHTQLFERFKIFTEVTIMMMFLG